MTSSLNPAPVRRDPGLDLLRAIAIIWVLIYHAKTQGLGRPLSPIGDIGWMGVDLFFVLSGYLIGSQLLKGYAVGQPLAFGQFYLRRAFRILPAYFVMVACYFCLPNFREAPGIQPAWQFLTFTENLLLDFEHNRAFTHAWSLCVEEHFYMIVPLLVAMLMRRPSWKVTAALCVSVVVGGMLLRWYLWSGVLNGGEVLKTQPWRFAEVIYNPTYARVDGLLAGVILAAIRWFRPDVWSKAMARPYTLLAIGAVGMAAAIWISAARMTFAASVFGFPLIAFSMAVILTACVSPHSVLGRWRIPGVHTVAAITFSLYLSHKMTWHVIRTQLPSLVAGGGYRSYAVYAVGSLLVAGALYLLVEKPFLQLRNWMERGSKETEHAGQRTIPAAAQADAAIS